jgi:shikimate kinase
MHNIYLVGLMGAGKTTIGKLLAKHLSRTFYDSDAEIEKRTGVNIPLIFELEGESGFRKREVSMIHELTAKQGIVLATGGGAILDENNRQRLKNGVTIYLRAQVSELWSRTKNDKTRPLLQTANPKKRLEDLYAQRDPLYREVATLIVDTGGQPAMTLVNQIETQLKSFLQ